MNNKEQTPAPVTQRMKWLGVGVLSLILSFVACFAIVLFFIKRIFVLKKDSFDFRVFDLFKPYVSDSLTSFMECFTLFGSQYFLIPAYLFLMFYFFFIKKDRWLGIKVAAVSITSLIVMFSLKLLFQRPRPMMPLLREVEGLSFPSGHAFMSFSFFGLLIYILHKTSWSGWTKTFLTIFLALFILLIGVSRVYLRVHYASDVITGFCMGFMWMVISLVVLKRIQVKFAGR